MAGARRRPRPGPRLDPTPPSPPGTVVPAQRRAARPPQAAPVEAVEGAAGGAAAWDEQPWWIVARVAASRAVLSVLLTLLAWSLLPMALGWSPHVIVSGSMRPGIEAGDVVVTRTVDPAALERGDVVTTVDPDRPEQTRTHRFVRRDAAGRVVTRGDANAGRDSSTVSDDDVLGQAVLLVPLVGKPAYWFATRDLLALGGLVVVLGGLVLAAWSPRRIAATDRAAGRSRDSRGARGAHLAPRPRRARGRRTGAVVTALEVVVLVTALVPSLAAAAPATHAAYVARTLNPVSSLSASPAFRPYRDAVLADAPSMYWRLDEKVGGALADTSGNGRVGTSYGATMGKAGALTSEAISTAAGLDDSVLAAATSSTVATAYSVEAWVRTTSTTGGPVLALTNALNGGTNDRALYLGSDGLVRFANSLGTGVVGTRVNDGQWHHLVFTSEVITTLNTRGTLYVDGRQVALGAAVGTATSGWWNAGRSTFSGLLWAGSPSNALRADVDEIAVYPTVLSATRVQQHYVASGH